MLIVVEAVIQFAAQYVAVELLPKSRPNDRGSGCMPLYPLPAMIALAGWNHIALSKGLHDVAVGLAMLAAGAIIYLVKARHAQEWPFAAL